ncbi:sensor histidine kinase [Halopenitus sp. H-Gu1]|uniref:sensor histidine kinase n=1 Tax=Halopenitus sp. H-Gu1 TaxID=3242697 RepID=UPI00359E8D78
MNSPGMEPIPRRYLTLGVVSGSGLLLAGAHLIHALTEETTLALLFGGALPFVIALAVAVGGYQVCHSDLPDDVLVRIGGWVGAGMGLMGLFGGGAIGYEYAEGARQFNEGYVVLTFITLGAAAGLLLGWYDARRYVLTNELRAKQRELEQQNERLEKFASVVTHDLRNPLNVATGRLDLINEEGNTEHIAAIRRAHSRMETLIDDVLTLTQTGQSIGNTKQVRVQQTASQAWDQVDTESASLDVTIDMVIEADASRLQQLFGNLFRNTVEHGGDNVSVCVGRLNDDCGFYIEDDGHGIPEDEREQIFEYGYSTASDGTGLGLEIVHQIVQGHGWTITVTQAADGGARFEIRGVTQADVGDEWHDVPV